MSRTRCARRRHPCYTILIPFTGCPGASRCACAREAASNSCRRARGTRQGVKGDPLPLLLYHYAALTLSLHAVSLPVPRMHMSLLQNAMHASLCHLRHCCISGSFCTTLVLYKLSFGEQGQGHSGQLWIRDRSSLRVCSGKRNTS